MSSDAAVPRTAVPEGITDPVARARAELSAALYAIEEKANIPKRVATATRQRVSQARRFAQRKPAAAVLAAVGAAATVGVAMWGFVRLYTR